MTDKAVETMLEKASELPEYSETTRPDTYFKSGFRLGYHQAEKELALTWEDIREICKQSVLVEIDLGGLVSDERHYTEVLKRFKNLKK